MGVLNQSECAKKTRCTQRSIDVLNKKTQQTECTQHTNLYSTKRGVLNKTECTQECRIFVLDLSN